MEYGIIIIQKYMVPVMQKYLVLAMKKYVHPLLWWLHPDLNASIGDYGGTDSHSLHKFQPH